MTKITCFGEVLWDVFPEQKRIGGAPLNVASRLSSFHNKVSIISKIGNDDDGKQILKFLKDKEVIVKGIQTDTQLKTGTVTVKLNAKGSASYTIMNPRAWDNIVLNDKIKALAKQSEAFVYGSLVVRNEVSKKTLYGLLKIAKYKIFDINLRPPYYTMDVLEYLMQEADFIKFNDDEIIEISEALGSKSRSLKEHIFFIAQKTQTKTICVTKGSHGAILYYDNIFYDNNGYKIKVADTVGAGDSFLAALIDQLFKKKLPQQTLDFACAVGAIVASNKGANPQINDEDIQQLTG